MSTEQLLYRHIRRGRRYLPTFAKLGPKERAILAKGQKRIEAEEDALAAQLYISAEKTQKRKKP